MKFFLIFTTIFGLFIQSCSSQEESKINMDGKTIYSNIDGGVDSIEFRKDGILSSIERYDNEGSLVQNDLIDQDFTRKEYYIDSILVGREYYRGNGNISTSMRIIKSLRFDREYFLYPNSEKSLTVSKGGTKLREILYYDEGGIFSETQYSKGEVTLIDARYYGGAKKRELVASVSDMGWYESGQLSHSVIFSKSGEPISKTEWYEEGSISRITKYVEKGSTIKEWYKEGSINIISSRDEYGNYHGPYKEYLEDGTVFKNLVYKHGVPNTI